MSEAIEDGNMDMLDNSDFVETDIPPPYKMGLPPKQFLGEDEREDVRDWVLTLSVDAEVDQTLPTRSCDNCGTDIYEAALACHNCHTQYPSCIVSGECRTVCRATCGCERVHLTCCTWRRCWSHRLPDPSLAAGVVHSLQLARVEGRVEHAARKDGQVPVVWRRSKSCVLMRNQAKIDWW